MIVIVGYVTTTLLTKTKIGSFLTILLLSKPGCLVVLAMIIVNINFSEPNLQAHVHEVLDNRGHTILTTVFQVHKRVTANEGKRYVGRIESTTTVEVCSVYMYVYIPQHKQVM